MIRVIILLLISAAAQGQVVKALAMMKPPVAAAPQRVLIDFGGNGVNDIGVTDAGVMTPSNTSTNFPVGIDATTGYYWNNWCSGVEGVNWVNNPKDITNTTVSGFSISIDVPGTEIKPSGNAADSSMNFGGPTTAAVGDYPVTAIRDNIYFAANSQIAVVNMTVVVPAGKKASVKFWGSRAATGPRIMQIKLSGDASYTQEYDAAAASGTAGNTTFTQGVTFTNVTGTQVFNLRTKTGSTNAYLSVMDVTVENQ